MKYFAMLTVTPFINTKGLVHPFQSGRVTYWDFYYILVANSMMAVLNISMVAYSVIITTSLIHFILCTNFAIIQSILPRILLNAYLWKDWRLHWILCLFRKWNTAKFSYILRKIWSIKKSKSQVLQRPV